MPGKDQKLSAMNIYVDLTKRKGYFIVYECCCLDFAGKWQVACGEKLNRV